jgi:hypothetical protein
MTSRVPVVAEVAVTVGLVVVIVGTFLPWVRSGRATRDAYGASGLLRHLLHVDGARGELLSLLPYAAIASAVAVAAIAVGAISDVPAARWAGLVLAVVVSGGAAAGAVAALRATASFLAGPSDTGPDVVLAGSALVWTAVLVRLICVKTPYTVQARGAGR